MPKPKDASDEEVKVIVDGLLSEFGLADEPAPVLTGNGASAKPAWSSAKKGASPKR